MSREAYPTSCESGKKMKEEGGESHRLSESVKYQVDRKEKQ